MSGIELFQSKECDARIYKTLGITMEGMAMKRSLIPYLLQEDRIACEYESKKGGFKVQVGGYYRFYDPDKDMIFVSSFDLPAQYALSSILKKKLVYVQWFVTKINRLYLTHEVAKRVGEARVKVLIEAQEREAAIANGQTYMSPSNRSSSDDPRIPALRRLGMQGRSMSGILTTVHTQR